MARILFIIVCAIGASGLLANPAFCAETAPELKVGKVSLETVFAKADLIEGVAKELENRFKARVDEIRKSEAALRPGDEAAKKEFTAQIQALTDDVQAAKLEKMQSVLAAIKTAVAAAGREGRYALVILADGAVETKALTVTVADLNGEKSQPKVAGDALIAFRRDPVLYRGESPELAKLLKPGNDLSGLLPKAADLTEAVVAKLNGAGKKAEK